MSFMNAELTNKQEWVEVDSTQGVQFIPAEIVDMQDLRILLAADDLDKSAAYALLGDYLECHRAGDIYTVEITLGYGVRSSAAGYMDCTEWSVYSTKKEAERAARDEQRACEGKDY